MGRRRGQPGHQKQERPRHTRTAQPRTPTPATEPDHEPHHHPHNLWGELLRGLLVIALVVAAKVQFEHTPTGRWMRLATYDLLQQRLTAATSPDPPVTILDISALPGPERGLPQTPRSNLRDLVEAVADQGARRIGIDIDFAPDKGVPLSRADEAFFRVCQSQHPRVFLGVERSLDRPAEERLGKPEFAGLAANIVIPEERRPAAETAAAHARSREGEPGHPAAEPPARPESERGHGEEHEEELGVRTVPLWIQAANVERSPSLSAALSGRLDPLAPDDDARDRVHPLVRGLVEDYSDLRRKGEFDAKEFLVDYSSLDRIEEGAVSTIDPAKIAANRERFAGKIVILGDLQPSGADMHQIPGRRRSVSGAAIHACAVDTLLDRAPLLQLSHEGRIVVDGALSLAVMGIVLGGVALARKLRVKTREESVHAAATWGAVLGAFLVAVPLVRLTRLMWDDFIMVLIALLVHSHFEHAVTWGGGWLWGLVPRPPHNSEHAPKGEHA